MTYLHAHIECKWWIVVFLEMIQDFVRILVFACLKCLLRSVRTIILYTS